MLTKPRTSPQKAIHAHCKGCIYDPKAGGSWIEQVEACPVTQCELYEHRKLTAKTRRLQRENDLAALTPSEREIVLKRKENISRKMANARASRQSPTPNEFVPENAPQDAFLTLNVHVSGQSMGVTHG